MHPRLWGFIALSLVINTSCTHSKPPLVIHVLRDNSASFAQDLRQADLEFAKKEPHLRNGRGLIVGTNEGSFEFHLGRFSESVPDLVIFDSESSIPTDPSVRKQLLASGFVCGQHPAYIPMSISGDEREAADMYRTFLASTCIASTPQLPQSAVNQTPEAGDMSDADPNRPVCKSNGCKKIKDFLKQHYCGESPFGNGPDDGCDLRTLKKTVTDTTLVADYECKWNEVELKTKCKQKGDVSPDIREIVTRELRRIGLPAGGEKELNYKILTSKSTGWTLVGTDYRHISGDDLALCEVVILLDQQGSPKVLRSVPIKKTDADVPDVTTWQPTDLADVDGDGNVEIVLQGDSYENHWLEVDSMKDGKQKKIFSGLGYYL